MKQEDKELQLKGLCARLPYGVKVSIPELQQDQIFTLTGITQTYIIVEKNNVCEFNVPINLDFKPYLRPMSSMTEEEFEKLKEYSGLKYEQLDLASYQNGTYKCLDFYLSEVPSYVVILVFDWLNAHHFDFRGLIEKGLAIEVTEEMYTIKEK